MGANAERIDFDGAALKSRPGALADEAASLSLFGGKRWVRVTGMGEESLAAVEAQESAIDALKAENAAVKALNARNETIIEALKEISKQKDETIKILTNVKCSKTSFLFGLISKKTCY